MESSLKLHAYKHSNNLYKVLVTAKLANVNVDVALQPATRMPQETVESSPTNTYPVLETSEGNLSESSAIVTYIGEKGSIAGSNSFERAQIAQWTWFANADLQYLSRDLIYPVLGYLPNNAESAKRANDRLKSLLKSLNTHLANRKTLVGSNYTTADVELFFALRPYFQIVLVEALRNKLYANVTTWFTTLASHDAVKNTIGLVHLCKVALKAPKVEEPKKEVSKKEEAKKEKTEDEPKEEKKKVDVFPETKMDFDKFKKDFCNSTDRKAVLDHFFKEEYDKNAFSVYKVKYQKLESEGKVLFKTENGRDGFLERCDPFRKHMFGTLGVFGEEENYDIKGLFLWRGKGIPKFLEEEHPQFEYYERVELDPSKDSDRKTIDEYWLRINPGDEVDGQVAVSTELYR